MTIIRIVTHGVGLVLRSEHAAARVGDHVYGTLGMWPGVEFGFYAERCSADGCVVQNTSSIS